MTTEEMDRIKLADLISDQAQDFASLTRQVNAVKSLIEDEKPPSVLASRAEFIKHLWATCQGRNAQIYRIATATEKREEQYFKTKEFGVIEEIVFQSLDALTEGITEGQARLQLAQPPERYQHAGTNEFNQNTLSSIKLPRIDLITFSGISTEWQTFRDTFVSLVINNQALDNFAKLHYLRSSLKGEALDTIGHIEVNSDNLEVAWNLLLNQYDNKIALINAHLNALFSIAPIKQESNAQLSMLRSSVKKHIGAFCSLGRNTDGYNDILINRVVALLDSCTKRDWELLIASKKVYPTFDELDEFLLERIRALESLSCKPSTHASTSCVITKGMSKFQAPQVKSHFTSTSSERCVICHENHSLLKCKQFRDSNVQERFDIVKQKKLCINCLKPNHRIGDCKNPIDCFKCHKRHHTWLHREPQVTITKEDDPDQTQLVLRENSSGMQIANQSPMTSHLSIANSINPSQIMLATARVWVLSPSNRAVRVRALLDQGSTWTFMSRELARVLGLKCTRYTSTSLTGIGECNIGTVSSVAEIRLSANMHGEPALKTTAFILPSITAYEPMCQASLRSWEHLKDLRMADDPSSNDPIHLLIGANMYGDLILDGVKKGRIGEPIAQNTIFGWVISGKVGKPLGNTSQSIAALHCSISNKSLDASLKHFWEIEEIPRTPICSIEDELCEAHFRKTHTRAADGRYIVRIPFKTEGPLDVGESRIFAELTQKRIESRFAKNSDHKDMYIEFMREYESLNHMELVNKANANNFQGKPVYLPHHPVYRDNSQTTKLRVVFNASHKTSNNTSLNDHMHTGPALQADLPTILLQWRSFQFVYTADIAKMYRQILVNLCNVDYQRIVWRENPTHPMNEYRLLTVTYGMRSAPFLALRVIKQLVEDEGDAYPLAVPVLLHDTFVDDILFGAHELSKAIQMRLELVSLLQKGKLQARKWTSNEKSLLEGIDSSDHGLAWVAPSEDNKGVKIRGLNWNPQTDSFHFKVTCENLTHVTKRSVLSLLSKLFDPMGWISPIIIVGKIFMQTLWKDQYAWDDPLPSNLTAFIVEFFDSLHNLNRISIPRWTHFAPQAVDVQLHGFSDASERAYGAVIYLRVSLSPDYIIVSLLISKTKVAPIKQLSIPRLELQAAVLLARLMDSIRRVRSLSDVHCQCWTDAGIVLTWLSQHASKWKTFIANRVSEIHSLIPASQWRYVPGESNPADLLSRGKSVNELADLPLWWNGPQWLGQAPEQWPEPLAQILPNIDMEAKSLLHVNLSRLQNTSIFSELFTRCSTWLKILQVAARVTKFIKITKSKLNNEYTVQCELSTEDIQIAEMYVLKELQELLFPVEVIALKQNQPIPKKSKLLALNPYFTDGLIRVGGRLSRAEIPVETKHPIVLSRHRVTTLIIEDMHRRCLHGGVKLTLSTLRQTYWVLNPRPQVKAVIFKCLACAKARATLSNQIMADLPIHRVTQPARAFSDCGIDYAGPLQVREVGGRGHRAHSCYISIFVCFAVKAVHLELVMDYSAEAFISAFKRFVARRGFPTRMYSDCGTNFRGADRELKSAFEQACTNPEFRALLIRDRISWRFNPPAAPHFGGLWEAGVRSVKGHLKRILGDKTPTIEEFSTLLCQIESALNSRPLGPLTDHIDDFDPLTPGHFLTGGSLVAVPQPSLIELNINRFSRWQRIQQCFEIFWKRWSTDYLQSLQQRSKWRLETNDVKVGQLLLLKQPHLPPTKWLLGRIEECYPSLDGKVRVVRVKTAKSSFLRPITELAILPIDLENNKDHILLPEVSIKS